MYNKSNLGDKCYVCDISNYTNRILETSTYLTGGISLPKVFLQYKADDIVQSKHKNHT